MKFTVQVDQCQQCSKSQASGVNLICSLTGRKENFYGDCPNFSQVGTESASLTPLATKKKTKVEKPKKGLAEENYDRGNSSNETPKIFLGILMIAGALIWFFAGLAAGIIFYYPPVLLIIGIITIVRGTMKK